MKQRQCIIQSCLPEDIAFKIISFLEESEVCALGCCSRFWRNLCGSDCIWESLSKQRWPLLNNESSSVQNSDPTSEPEYVAEALKSRKISDRQVCVKWWKLGRWFYGFRMRDEYHSRWVSLADLVTKKEEEVLGVLHRGAIHEVLRVQISFVISVDTPWFSRGTLGQG
ncbi:F-box domain-containing protein [Citrus sinensis]|uniref:F-box domain-containing protein n=1 Tax=Citrus sinensis TaxID=2711 RepID=A0ACB8I886_CITSI|nr:F-box domain-containing protein [Citrus sinensis]